MDTTLFLESTVHFYSYTHFMPVHIRKKHVNGEAIRRTISRKRCPISEESAMYIFIAVMCFRWRTESLDVFVFVVS